MQANFCPTASCFSRPRFSGQLFAHTHPPLRFYQLLLPTWLNEDGSYKLVKRLQGGGRKRGKMAGVIYPRERGKGARNDVLQMAKYLGGKRRQFAGTEEAAILLPNVAILPPRRFHPPSRFLRKQLFPHTLARFTLNPLPFLRK